VSEISRCFAVSVPAMRLAPPPLLLVATLETTQGQMGGVFSQLPYKYRFEEVASVGDWLKVCPQLDFRDCSLLSLSLRRGWRPLLFFSWGAWPSAGR